MAETRVRDLDGRLRRVSSTADSVAAARRRLQEKLQNRPRFGHAGMLWKDSAFPSLVDLWLRDLELQDLADGTKDGYRDQVRLQVMPAFENFTLGEITTGRVEWFLKQQAALSDSQARRSRTMLNLLFSFALRHDAIDRNPVEGTSQLKRSKDAPQALSLEQVAAIRCAAAAWRTEPGRPGPKPDGQVRDILEVLLGTAMRIGEVLGLRIRDARETKHGLVLSVNGTVIQRKGTGTVRQPRPKSESSIREILVPEFVASVLRRRLKNLREANPDRTIFANRTGGPLSAYNVRRTFREMLAMADLQDSGISLRWYRRTAATVIARGMGVEAAADFLGHSSTVITEGHYVQPEVVLDAEPSRHLELTLRPVDPDGRLLALPVDENEEMKLDQVDIPSSDDADPAA